MTPHFQKMDTLDTIKVPISNYQLFYKKTFVKLSICLTYILKYFDLLIFHFLREALLGLHDLALLGVFLLPS